MRAPHANPADRRSLNGSPVAGEVQALEDLRGTVLFRHVFFIGYE
jgi:hypothetical protein